MKVTYKLHEIEARREVCLGGYSLLYYSIMLGDYECLSSFQDSAETTFSMIEHMKSMVDSEMAEDQPWGEFEKSETGELVGICDGDRL
jgi:hypothetical protein